MAGELEKSDDYIKLLYINGLFQHTIDPYYALASMASIKVNGVSVSTADHGATLPQSSIDAINKLKAVAKSLPAPKTTFEVDALKIDIDGEVYSFDRRLSLYISICLTNQGYSEAVINQYIAKLSLWDVLVMDAALFSAEDPVRMHFIQQATQAEDLIATDEANQKFINEQLYKLAVDYFILPTIQQLDELELVEDSVSKKQVVSNTESRVDIDRVAKDTEFLAAAKVFSACETQITAGHVPEAFQPMVYSLVDKTAEGLVGNYDSKSYLETVGSLPLECTAFRIIVGAALVFAGLILAAAAIMLAVHSFGVSTPLSALGVKAGVDLMIAGAAIAVATTTLAMVGAAGFFATSKHQKSEMAEKAEDFHAHQAASMGG